MEAQGLFQQRVEGGFLGRRLYASRRDWEELVHQVESLLVLAVQAGKRRLRDLKFQGHTW